MDSGEVPLQAGKQFTFRATAAGNESLVLQYRRGWEKKPPKDTFTVEVVVKE